MKRIKSEKSLKEYLIDKIKVFMSQGSGASKNQPSESDPSTTLNSKF